MEDRKLTESESLELITQMIRSARTNQRAKINCNILLFWGYTTVIITCIIWLLKIYDVFQHSSLLWLIIPAVCYPAARVLSAKENVPVKSYLDQLIDYVTILFIIVCTALAFTTIWVNFPIILPTEGILFGIWAVIIGLLIKYKPVIYGGIAGIIVANGMIFIDNMNNQILVFAIIVIVSLLIPGHLLKREISKNV